MPRTPLCQINHLPVLYPVYKMEAPVNNVLVAYVEEGITALLHVPM